MAYHIFIDHILRAEAITVFGDGDQTRSNTYVDDAVTATILARERGKLGGVYNVGGGEARDLNWVIGAIERMDTLHTKLHKLATELGLPTIKELGYQTKEAFVQKKLYLLRSYA